MQLKHAIWYTNAKFSLAFNPYQVLILRQQTTFRYAPPCVFVIRFFWNHIFSFRKINPSLHCLDSQFWGNRPGPFPLSYTLCNSRHHLRQILHKSHIAPISWSVTTFVDAYHLLEILDPKKLMHKVLQSHLTLGIFTTILRVNRSYTSLRTKSFV